MPSNRRPLAQIKVSLCPASCIICAQDAKMQESHLCFLFPTYIVSSSLLFFWIYGCKLWQKKINLILTFISSFICYIFSPS